MIPEKKPEPIDPSRVNPTPPSHEEIVNAIKACAMVAGQTKSVIEKTIKDEWLYGHEERIKEAMKALWTIFDGRERMHRKVIRAGRKENGMTFAKILQQAQAEKTKQSLKKKKDDEEPH